MYICIRWNLFQTLFKVQFFRIHCLPFRCSLFMIDYLLVWPLLLFLMHTFIHFVEPQVHMMNKKRRAAHTFYPISIICCRLIANPMISLLSIYPYKMNHFLLPIFWHFRLLRTFISLYARNKYAGNNSLIKIFVINSIFVVNLYSKLWKLVRHLLRYQNLIWYAIWKKWKIK